MWERIEGEVMMPLLEGLIQSRKHKCIAVVSSLVPVISRVAVAASLTPTNKFLTASFFFVSNLKINENSRCSAAQRPRFSAEIAMIVP